MIIIILFCGIIVSALGLVFAKNILLLLGTKQELISGAELYLKIYLAGMPATAVYDFGSSVYSASGNTKKPLIFLSIAGIVNIILNLSLVGPMGHAGLALATSISVAVSTIVSYVVFRKKYKNITLFTSWKKPVLSLVFSLLAVAASRFTYDFLLARIWMPRMVLLGLMPILTSRSPSTTSSTAGTRYSRSRLS